MKLPSVGRSRTVAAIAVGAGLVVLVLVIAKMVRGPRTEKSEIAHLIAKFKDQNSDPISSATHLAQIGKAAMPSLFEALRDDNPRVRSGAAMALGLMDPPDPAAIEPLFACAEVADAMVSHSAFRALLRFDPSPPGLVDALVRRMSAVNVLTKQFIIYGLQGIDCEDDAYVAALITALRDDPDKDVRFFALRALAHVGSEAKLAAPVIEIGLNDPDVNIVYWSAIALTKVEPRHASRSAEALISGMTRGDDIRRSVLAKAAGKIGPPARQTVPALLEVLRTQGWMGQSRAAEALGSIGSAEKPAVPALLDTLKGDGDRHDEVARAAA